MMQWLTQQLQDLESFALNKLLPAVVIFFIGYLVIRLLMRIVNTALEKTRLEQLAVRLIRSLLRCVLYIVLIFLTAYAMGVNLTGVLALAGVLTLAISLSVQNALTNVIGGFTLLYTKPFVAGDYVEISDQSGTVTNIGLTYTNLATSDNKIISIPNSAVVEAEIINYSSSGTRRVDIEVSVDFDVPAQTVTEALLEAASIPDVMASPAPFAGMSEYGQSAVVYTLQVWTDVDRYWPAKYTINQNIQSVFREKGISMAYPHMDVHLDK